jgi:hypothetical protein
MTKNKRFREKHDCAKRTEEYQMIETLEELNKILHNHTNEMLKAFELYMHNREAEILYLKNYINDLENKLKRQEALKNVVGNMHRDKP